MRPQISEVVFVLLVILLLGVLSWQAYHEPILPDEDDCRAWGRPADCWRIYGRPPRPTALKPCWPECP